MQFDQVMVMDEFRYGAECDSLRFPALARIDAIRPGTAGWFLSICAVLAVLALGIDIATSRQDGRGAVPRNGTGALTTGEI
jgi:hypothetical protein